MPSSSTWFSGFGYGWIFGLVETLMFVMCGFCFLRFCFFFFYLFEVWFGNLVSTAIDYECILRKVNYIYSLLTTLYLISFSNAFLMPNFIYRLHDISLNQSQRKLQRKPQRKFCFKIA